MGGRLTFLGHSTVLIDVDGVRVLTDPLLGNLAWGAIRRHVPAVLPDALGDHLSAVFISHGHLDHLDLDSLRALPDPLADFGSRAVEDLLRLAGFSNAGDLILLGAMDGVTKEVTGFEELVGSHGGLGGWQTEPFILCPTGLKLADDPPVGAPALYRQLTAWQAQLREKGG